MQAITRSHNFIFIWDSRYGEAITEEYCNLRRDQYKTAIWKGDFEGGKCVELLSQPGGPMGSAWPDTNCDNTGSDMEPCYHEPRRPTRDWMDKATDKYGVDMKAVIDSAIECAFNNPGEPDVASVEVGGGVPHCFFNLPVKRGKWVVGTRTAKHPVTRENVRMGIWDPLDTVYHP